ncbi:MAG: 4-hydroxyphenylacetate 3-monooxygenase [Chloroflexota bacterium]|nr:4-hydroxyphenylacetate 3-monooxygenase [Chloroflexota bacterium]
MAARTGAEFLAGLRDDRVIWFQGEQVADVTAHPVLGRMARSLAALYDLQWDPVLRPQLTFSSPSTGDPVSLAFLQPRSIEDLIRKRTMYGIWAEQSGGMLGRTPDYLNAILAGCASASAYFARNGAEFGERIVRYYTWCRERDLCATHTFLDPQSNRARTQSEQADPTVPLHIVETRQDGILVRGARMLATLAPFADELLVFPSPSRVTPTDAPRFAFAFAIPVATPGLKFICRESFDLGRPEADHPLASRFEEMDAVAVFEDVLVPAERIFLQGDIGRANGLFRLTNIFTHGIHQFTAKNVAKAEFVFGVTSLVAEAIGRTEIPAYQQLLGEMVDVVETLRAFLRTMEADARFDEFGDFVPSPRTASTARNYFPKAYPRLVEILQLIGSSGLMATPTEADAANPELAADVERYYQSATLMGRERVRLFRLAWDIACSSFGGRQVLYERFFAGDPFALLSTRYLSYDLNPIEERVRSFLARSDTSTSAG